MQTLKILRIAKYIITATVLLVFVLQSTYVNAKDETVSWGSLLKFYMGITAGFLIHEGSHAVVAGLTNTDMDWRWGDINQPFQFTEHASSDTEGAAINSAGLISQSIGSEIILRTEKIDKNNNFVRGMMTWNIVNPILYTMDYWFFHKTNSKDDNTYQGDLQGIERYTNETTADGFALAMLAIATSQEYRFIKTQSWAPNWMQNQSHTVSFAPLPSGGMVMMYKVVF
ncbi:MAG: hypothetical protein SVY10_18475 [Thermodesulfobacteriota bacterium]|nr:hypothetical protein [Thermodesulfobacteriota bacterium]